MSEKIGLEGVLELSNFNRGLSQYLGGIKSMESGTLAGARAITGGFSAVGLGVIALGTTIGNLVAGALQDAFRGLVNLGREALDSVGNYERLGLALRSLVTVELMRGQTVEQTTQKIIGLSGKEQEELTNLTEKRTRLTAALAVQQEHYQEAIAAGKLSTAELEVQAIQISQTSSEISSLSTEIEALARKSTELSTVVQQVTTGQLSMSEAMAKAGPIAKELLGWIQALAINSPFTTDEVAKAFRLALAYGFTSTEAKGLTEAMIDFSSGSGATGEAMQRIALALGQIRARGKLSAQEINQLSEAGINLRQSLADSMHISVQEVNKLVEDGLIPAEQAIEAVTQSMNMFKGAAQEQASTLPGLISSLTDIRAIGLREFFTESFEAFKPLAKEFVEFFSEGGGFAMLGNWGKQVGETAVVVVAWIRGTLIPAFQEFGHWFIEVGLPAFQTFAANARETLLPVFSSISEWIITQGLPAFLLFSGWLAEAGSAAVKKFSDFISSPAFQAGLKTLTDGVGGFLDKVGSVLSSDDPLKKLKSELADLIPPDVQKAFGEVSKAFGHLIEAVIKHGPEISRQWQEIFSETNTQRIKTLVTVLESVARIIETVASIIDKHGPTISAVLGGAFRAASTAVNVAMIATAGYVEIQLNTISRNMNIASSAIKGDWGGAWREIKALSSDNMAAAERSIRSSLDSILSNFGTDTQALTQGWRMAFLTMKYDTGKGMSDIIYAITSKGFEIYMQVGTIVTKMLDAFFSLPAKLYTIGADIISGLIRGITSMLGNLLSTVGNLVSQIISQFMGLLGIHSPSSVAARAVGIPIGEGVAQGIWQSLGAIKSAISGVTMGALSGAAPSSIAAPAPSYASYGGNTTTIDRSQHYTMPVHTSQSPQVVKHSFSILRAASG